MGTLTVRENLMFSANLRLPEEKTFEERTCIVDDAITELGLGKCADTKVPDSSCHNIIMLCCFTNKCH